MVVTGNSRAFMRFGRTASCHVRESDICGKGWSWNKRARSSGKLELASGCHVKLESILFACLGASSHRSHAMLLTQTVVRFNCLDAICMHMPVLHSYGKCRPTAELPTRQKPRSPLRLRAVVWRPMLGFPLIAYASIAIALQTPRLAFS